MERKQDFNIRFRIGFESDGYKSITNTENLKDKKILKDPNGSVYSKKSCPNRKNKILHFKFTSLDVTLKTIGTKPNILQLMQIANYARQNTKFICKISLAMVNLKFILMLKRVVNIS